MKPAKAAPMPLVQAAFLEEIDASLLRLAFLTAFRAALKAREATDP